MFQMSNKFGSWMMQQVLQLAEILEVSRGLVLGYHPKAVKTHLIVKLEHEACAAELFSDTNVQITIQGK